MRVDGAFVRLESHAPHRIQKLCPGEDTSRLAGHGGEQLELSLRQLDGPASKARLHPAHVELDLGTNPDQFGRLFQAFRPAQHTPDAGHELLRAERLGDVVVGSKLEPHQLVRLLAAGGQHDDRDVAITPQRPSHIEAVLTGQAQVEHHQVRTAGPCGAQSRRAV